jgi:hypothetical protein
MDAPNPPAFFNGMIASDPASPTKPICGPG